MSKLDELSHSHAQWENYEKKMEYQKKKPTWRSLGDSNPCFRRERVNTCILTNTGDRLET
jgi:hypothetical protein